MPFKVEINTIHIQKVEGTVLASSLLDCFPYVTCIVCSVV